MKIIEIALDEKIIEKIEMKLIVTTENGIIERDKMMKDQEKEEKMSLEELIRESLMIAENQMIEGDEKDLKNGMEIIKGMREEKCMMKGEGIVIILDRKVLTEERIKKKVIHIRKICIIEMIKLEKFTSEAVPITVVILLNNTERESLALMLAK